MNIPFVMHSFLRTIVGLLVLVSATTFSQPFVRQVEPFSVLANGEAVALPFAGGVNSPTHQFVDIDGDGDQDLFVFDVDLAVDFYRNEGTPVVPRFALRNGLITLPRFNIWFLFVDFDGDGRIDLCTEDSLFSGVRVYRNSGTTQSPNFSLFIPTLHDTNGADVFGGSNSIPTFADIDADGDYDFFSNNVIGTVNFYHNVGTPMQPRYAFVPGNWQNIFIFSDSCATSGAPLGNNPMHGAGAFTFADIDGDSDLDMFISDLFWTQIFALRNTGSPTQPQMQCWTNHFPENDPVVSNGYNLTSFVDIDADGDKDMFVGVLTGIVQQNGFLFYRNNGNATAPNLQFVTSNFISTIDVGMNAHPVFVDVDRDGDQDMLVGNLNGGLTFFQNTGSSTSPSLTLTDSVYLNVANDYFFSPAFADIDNDGDKDLFAGMYFGRIKFFRNTGTPQNPQFVLTGFATDSINVTNNATPAFVDIDGDGDMDLFVGKKDGSISYYRNDGSDSIFTPVLVTQTFLDIAAGQDSYLTPTFSDYDNDGDFDLFFGAFDGRLVFYENTGTALNAQFILRTEHFASIEPLHDSAPAFVDIDADGDQDLFVGGTKGGIQFYKNNRLGTPVNETERIPEVAKLFQNYPNPFNPTTEIRFQISEIRSQSKTRPVGKSEVSHAALTVYDVLGREVASLVNGALQPGSYTTFWDASNFTSGVYFYTLTTEGASFTRKMILMK